MPIIEKAMADFLLRISINSSYIVLGLYDIASEGFYKHSVAEFFDQIPEHLSYPNEFSPYLKPYVSEKFRNIVHSDFHELIIGSFFKYFLVRLPVLVRHGRFSDWPKIKGVSEDDLSRIVPYSTVRFQYYFPNASEKFQEKGLYNHETIFHQYAKGKEMAYLHKLQDKEMINFLYDHGELLTDIIEIIPGLKQRWNTLTFFADCFDYNFKRFWESFYSDYMDTLRHWSYSGAFIGEELIAGFSHEYFWEDLEKRLDNHDFILRGV